MGLTGRTDREGGGTGRSGRVSEEELLRGRREVRRSREGWEEGSHETLTKTKRFKRDEEMIPSPRTCLFSTRVRETRTELY